MTLISQRVPQFTMPAVSIDALEPRTIALSDYLGRWLLVIFYPRDFSFVCPTELTSFSGRAADFARRNCDLLGVSIDTIESHANWLRTPVGEGGLARLLGDEPVAVRYAAESPPKSSRGEQWPRASGGTTAFFRRPFPRTITGSFAGRQPTLF